MTANKSVTASFAGTIPTITSITPDHGVFGDTVTVAGTVFGSSPSGYLNGGLIPHITRDSISYVFRVTDLGVEGIVQFVIKNNVYNTYDTVDFSFDTIPNLLTSYPEFSKLAGGGHGILTGSGLSAIDTLRIGDSIAIIDSAHYDSLWYTIPEYHERGGVMAYTVAHYGYVDSIFALSYKNLHISSLTPPSGRIGDTISLHAIWGLGTTGLGVTIGDSAATVVAGYVDTLARVIAPNNRPGLYQVRTINGAGDTTFNQWQYSGGARKSLLYYKIY
jgi:hypothetical protein